MSDYNSGVRLQEVLALPAFKGARVLVEPGSECDIRWVHTVDIPEPFPWIQPGQLLLTTGYAWPREEAAQRKFIQRIAERGPAAIGMAVPQFFEHFPQAARKQAARLGLPVLELQWEVPFAQITQEVHQAILAEQYQVIQRSEAIHKALTQSALEAPSLAHLAGTLSELIGRSVLFEDAEAHVLAFVGQAEDAARQRTLEMGKSDPRIEEYLERIGIKRKIRESLGAIRIPALPEIGLSARVVCPIRLGGDFFGSVWMIEGNRPLSDLDLRAAEHAAVIAALHLTHQRELASQQARMGFAFLDALLEGRFEPTPQALERAHLLEFDPEGHYSVGILRMEEDVPLTPEGFARRERLTLALRRRLSDLKVPPLLSVSLNQIPFLLPEKLNPNQVWENLRSSQLSFAYSQTYQGWQGVAQGYREAQAMLPHLGRGEMRGYAELLLPRVLAGDAQAQAAFIGQLLQPIREQRGGEAIAQTLLAWARLGFHAKRTARVLRVHANTLRYRLERARELTLLNLDDPEVRFRLQLAAHILELKNKTSS